jgi:hypothetical protein
MFFEDEEPGKNPRVIENNTNDTLINPINKNKIYHMDGEPLIAKESTESEA